MANRSLLRSLGRQPKSTWRRTNRGNLSTSNLKRVRVFDEHVPFKPGKKILPATEADPKPAAPKPTGIRRIGKQGFPLTLLKSPHDHPAKSSLAERSESNPSI